MWQTSCEKQVDKNQGLLSSSSRVTKWALKLVPTIEMMASSPDTQSCLEVIIGDCH